MTDLFSAQIATLRAERDALVSARDGALDQANKCRHDAEVIDGEIRGFDRAIKALEAVRVPAEMPKPGRAKKGEIEAAIRAYLGATTNGRDADQIADRLSQHKPDSVKAVLRRLVSLGEIEEDGGLYRPKRAQQAAE